MKHNYISIISVNYADLSVWLYTLAKARYMYVQELEEMCPLTACHFNLFSNLASGSCTDASVPNPKPQRIELCSFLQSTEL